MAEHDNDPCPECGGDRLRPDYTRSGRCHAGTPPTPGPVDLLTALQRSIENARASQSAQPQPAVSDPWGPTVVRDLRTMLRTERAEHEQRATLLRRQVEDLTRERDELAENLDQQHAYLADQTKLTAQIAAERDDLWETDDVLRVDLALRDAEVAGLTTELERLRIVETASIGAHALLADAEAETERLRAELREVNGLLRETRTELAAARDAAHANARERDDLLEQLDRRTR